MTTRGDKGRMADRPSLHIRYKNLLLRGSTVAMGLVLAFGFAASIVFWGGFNTAFEMTNTEAFCMSCHSMKDNVYVEYKSSVHYSNRSGVRATCHDADFSNAAASLRQTMVARPQRGVTTLLRRT